MTRHLFLAALGFGTLALAADHAFAQSVQCADHATVVERLAEDYGETRQSIALGHDNTMVEVFASRQTGTWTITVTQAGGPTCLVAAGGAYQYVADRPAADHKDA